MAHFQIFRIAKTLVAGQYLGNPFRIGVDGDAATCVARFRDWMLAEPARPVVDGDSLDDPSLDPGAERTLRLVRG